MDEIKIFALNGQLGYGFPADSYKNGIAKNPDVIRTLSALTPDPATEALHFSEAAHPLPMKKP